MRAAWKAGVEEGMPTDRSRHRSRPAAISCAIAGARPDESARLQDLARKAVDLDDEEATAAARHVLAQARPSHRTIHHGLDPQESVRRAWPRLQFYRAVC